MATGEETISLNSSQGFSASERFVEEFDFGVGKKFYRLGIGFIYIYIYVRVYVY